MNPRPPKLTIGMAHHSDYYGLWQTLTDLRVDFLDLMPDIEIVVIDNSPGSPHSQSAQHLVGNIAEGACYSWDGRVLHKPAAAHRENDKAFVQFVREHPADVKYEILRDQGTSQSRNRIFEIATGDAVLVMDCHVKLWRGALQKLIEFYDAGHDDGNLLQGVLLYDNFQTYHTHMDDVIRGNMWGIWGVDPRGIPLEGEPFEIPAHGLGVFSCRRSAWLGFNKKFRGFGGEEYYIHRKYLAAGKKTLCLPFLRWLHRFDRPMGTGYVNDIRHRIRNYLIGHKELGLDLGRLKSYFRDGRPEDPLHEDDKRPRLSWMEWEQLCIDLEIDP